MDSQEECADETYVLEIPPEQRIESLFTSISTA